MMMIKHTFRHLALFAVPVAMLTFASPLAAQSDNELRRENQRLQGRVDELDKELQAARDRITRLEALIQEMRRAPGTSTTRPPSTKPEEEKISIDETKQDASPRALLAELQKDYEKTLGDLEIGAGGSRERDNYLRAVDRWVNTTSRRFRISVEWAVKILSQSDADRTRYLVRMQAVDPKYGTKLGDPFDATIRKSRSGNVDDLNLTYIVRGAILPSLRVNPDRSEQGMFNVPKFIGPYAEFIIGLEVMTIVKQSEADSDTGEGG